MYQKRKLKREYTISSETAKNTTFQTTGSTLGGGIGILDIDTQLSFIKTKWIAITSHQCSLERSRTVLLIEVNSEF